MDTTLIDSQINSLYQTALGQNPPQKITPYSISGTTGQSVKLELYSGPKGSGFQVIGEIVIGGYTARRVRQAGPETNRDKPWPQNIEMEAEQWVKDSISQAFSWADCQGFKADHKVTLLNKYVNDLAIAGNLTNLTASKPKLVAIRGWFDNLQLMAMNGKRFFPVAPYSFKEIIDE